MDPKKLAAAALAAASVGSAEDNQQAVVNFLDPRELAAQVFYSERERAYNDTSGEYQARVSEASRDAQRQKIYDTVVADRKRRAEVKKAKSRLKTEKARDKRKKAKKAKKRGR